LDAAVERIEAFLPANLADQLLTFLFPAGQLLALVG